MGRDLCLPATVEATQCAPPKHLSGTPLEKPVQGPFPPIKTGVSGGCFRRVGQAGAVSDVELHTYFSRTFRDQDELLAWAEDERNAHQAEAWS